MIPARHLNSADITAAILAGGEGRRLGGRDKGLEPLAGKPLIEYVIATLRPQARNLCICINRNNAQYATFAMVCPDRAGGFHGPLAGISAALAACETAWLLTVPVDCPRPPPDLAQRLLATGARAAVAHDGRHRQPLFALYHRDLAADAESSLQRDLPVWRWQDEVGAVEVDFSGMPQAFLNLNTVEDFRHWEEHHHE
jgi:molybdopterin-guanine dinucleotide biosynthesis protein A